MDVKSLDVATGCQSVTGNKCHSEPNFSGRSMRVEMSLGRSVGGRSVKVPLSPDCVDNNGSRHNGICRTAAKDETMIDNHCQGAWTSPARERREPKPWP